MIQSRAIATCLLTALAFNTHAATRFVDLNSPTPTPPYTNWFTAATNIQDAVDAATNGDLILVTNGLYNTGSRTTTVDSTPCRVVINKPVNLRGVNGSGATIIEGHSEPGNFPWSLNSVRCAYMTNGATLTGFTLSKGSVRATAYINLADPAGGVYCTAASAIVSNCVIIDCASYIGGGAQGGTFFNCLITNCIAHIGGGGVYGGNLDHCQVVWNTTDYYAGGLYYCQATNCNINDNLGLFGGGSYGGSIFQCTVSANYAPIIPNFGGGYGGGVNNVDCRNSIIYYNLAEAGGDDIVTGTYTNCCSPSPPLGAGNITNAPLFIDSSSFPANYHLQSNSPCINAGNTAPTSGPTDLDGRPRLAGPKVDIGSYEYQGATTNDFLRWLWTWHLPTTISSDFADPDGDTMNNWQEWRADTIPTNAASALLMGTVTNGVTGLVISWASVSTRSYWLERATNLAAPTPFHAIATNLAGVAGTKTFYDTTATNGGPYFYRVGVQ